VKRGDIIVFRWPGDIRQTFVKRVIGVPGDHIRFQNKNVYLNGHELKEPYVIHKSGYSERYRDNFPTELDAPLYPPAQDVLEHNVINGQVIVPADRYFAMGDSRDESLDSRYWGFVPRDNIMGKPLIIYWSYEASADDLSNPSVTLPHLIDIVIHFPTKTRWSRTFKLIHSYPVHQLAEIA
jgi:signal peptidase I